MFVLGLDIGYSNLKIAMGRKGEVPTTKILPACAVPMKVMPSNCSDFFYQVSVNGESWAAGVEPYSVGKAATGRSLNENYMHTDAYKALFYAALLSTEQDVIDKVVTGLPTAQALDKDECEKLANMMTGEHQIAPERTITVKEVVVVPQPSGAYMDIVMDGNNLDLLKFFKVGRTLVIDPGFFSVDWVSLVDGQIQLSSSGTSTSAMSKLLSETSDLIRKKYGTPITVEKIETGIRSGEGVSIGFKMLDIDALQKEASEIVAKRAITDLSNIMRDDLTVDIVLLAGGGAALYEAAARAAFPHSEFLTANDHVLSNARGFWYYG